MPDFHQIHTGENGILDLENRTVLRSLFQQVAGGSQIDRRVRDDLLADGVDGRVCHLRKELLEVAEQRLSRL